MKVETLKFFLGILLIFITNQVNAKTVPSETKRVLNVAVIGAGTSGLCSAKYSLQHGYNVTIYEQSEELGGIWYYTDKTGKDQYGIDIHTAMYKGLRYFCLQWQTLFKLFENRQN